MKKILWFLIAIFLFTATVTGAYAGFGATGDTWKAGPNQELRVDLLGNIHIQPGASDRYIYLKGKVDISGAQLEINDDVPFYLGDDHNTALSWDDTNKLFKITLSEGAVKITGSFEVTQNATFSKNISCVELNASGDVNITDDLFANEGTFTGNVNAAGGVFSGDISGANLTLTTALAATSAAFTGSISVGGNESIGGDLTVGQNFGLTGDATIGGALEITGKLTANTVDISGQATIKGGGLILFEDNTPAVFGTLGPADIKYSTTALALYINESGATSRFGGSVIFDSIVSSDSLFRSTTANANAMDLYSASGNVLFETGSGNDLEIILGAASDKLLLTQGDLDIAAGKIILANDEEILNSTDGIIDLKSAVKGIRIYVFTSNPDGVVDAEAGCVGIGSIGGNQYIFANAGGTDWWGITLYDNVF